MSASQQNRAMPGRRLYVKSIGSFVPKLAQKAFEKYGFSTVTLLTDWPVIVGAEFSRFTRPERLKWPRKVAVYGETDAASKGRPGATLVLRVDPARALEIQYGADQLIERINSFFGYNAVAAIRVLQAPVEDLSRRAATDAGRCDAGRSGTVGPGVSEGVAMVKRPKKQLGALAARGLGDGLVSGTAVADEGLRAALLRLRATF